MNNSTTGQPPKTVDALFSLSMIVINAFFSVLATVMNLVIIVTIVKTPSLRTNTNILILSLAITDFVVGVYAQPSYCAFLIMTNYLGVYSMALLLISLSPVILIFASLLTITATSVDRFLALHFHLRYQELVTAKRISMVLIAIWTFSVLWGTFILFLISKNVLFVIDILQVSHFIYISFLLFNIAVMLKISCIIRQHAAQIQVQQQAMNAQPGATRNIKRSVNIMYYIVGTFILCYVPEISVWSIMVFMPKLDMRIALDVAHTVILMNSSINPIIYFWRIPDMRNAALRLLRCLRRSNNINNNNDNSNATNISNFNL